jgi:cystathionine beta-lyase/cystathionine gamma-synthase
LETLIDNKYIMSYYGLTTEERAALGISDGLVRVSVGVEDVEDIREDLARVLAVVREASEAGTTLRTREAVRDAH